MSEPNDAPGANATSARADSTAPNVRDEVEAKYQAARNDGETLAVMVLARQIAEAVSGEMCQRLPPELRAKYSLKDLNGRLGILEEHAGRVGVPRYVIAALRTLQAYGNCASHYQAGEHRPPARATASAMASLAHVTQWFLQQEVDPDERKLELSLREPAPRRPPSFWERRRLMIAYPWDMPSLARGIRGEGNAILVSYSDSSVARLGALLQFHAREVSILVDICRAVLRRETTDDVNNASPDRLADMFDALCDLRPTVVPRAVSVQVREVVRRLKSVERAIRQRETQVDHFFTEAERKSALNEIVAWFEEAYVQRHFWRGEGCEAS